MNHNKKINLIFSKIIQYVFHCLQTHLNIIFLIVKIKKIKIEIFE